MDQLSLPGFELLGKIGQGGVATVWKARQLSLDRIVAIKVLSPRIATDPADIERFHVECRAAAMLKHPGIVQVYDAIVHNGLYCLIMEYVAGESLGDRIRRKKQMTEDEALSVLEHVAHALGHAWKTAGLIHCDIKPDNILIDADGSLKVTDLGLAMTIGAITSLAQTDEVMGTPQYMSPEQILGSPKLDCRTDIYSMGATLYQMLTGRMLFEGESEDAALDLQLKGQAPDALDLVPALSSRICWMAEKMLARNRDYRHADWDAVNADVERLMRRHYPAQPLPEPGASVMMRSTRRQKPQDPPAPDILSATSTRSAKESLLRAIVFIIILAALGAAAFFILSEISKKETVRELPPPQQLPMPSLPVRNAPATPSPETRAAEMLTFARSWWKDNPGRYQEAIERFDRVSRDTQGTQYALMALDDIRSVKQARDAAVREVMDQLKAKADSLAAEGRFQDAAAVYDAYSGPLADETRMDRKSEAGILLDREAGEAARRQEREQAAQNAYAAALVEISASAVRNPLADSLARVTEAEGRAALAPRREALKPISDLVRAAASLDRKILDSFIAQIGKEVTVQLAAGPRTLVISGAANAVVHGDQKVAVGEGVAAATVKIAFSLDDLAPRERLQRMGAETDPAVALFRGNAAALAGNFADAGTCFANIPGDFGAALLAALRQREAEAQPAMTAPASSPAAAAPTPAPASAAGESLAVDAFRTLLISVNPGLTAGEIYFERDEQDRVLKVSCRSRYLQKLEPFRKIAPSLVELSLAQTQTADLAPVAALVNLRRLDLSDTPVADLIPLKDLRLERLVLNNSRIKDVGPLRGMPLRELEIASTRVFAFDALRGLSLNRLNLANTQFSDLSYIKDMPLVVLNLSGTKTFDFSLLRRLLQLEELQLENTTFRDVGIVADLPLVFLNLSNTKVTDLNPLRQATLRRLAISGNNIRDLTGLKNLKLSSLRFDNCKIKDLTPLAGMPLQSLACNSSLVEDLTPIRGAALTSLEIAYTPIADLAPVADMPLNRAVLSYSKVTDLQPLARCPLRELHCAGLDPNSLLALRNTPLEVLYMDARLDRFPMGVLKMFPKLVDFNGRNPP